MVNICKGKKKLEGRKPKCWQCYLWDVHLQLVFSFHFCLNLGLSYDKHVFLLSEDTGFWWLGFLFFFLRPFMILQYQRGSYRCTSGPFTQDQFYSITWGPHKTFFRAISVLRGAIGFGPA